MSRGDVGREERCGRVKISVEGNPGENCEGLRYLAGS